MNTRPLKVLISGSGIAGSVFSHWLLRAHPTASITIVERAPSLRLSGAAVDIRSSAVEIIKKMNAEQEIRRCGTKEEGMALLNSNGDHVVTMSATGDTDTQSITSEYEIMRGTLNKIFIAPVQDRVSFLFNESVDRFEQHDDGVTVTLLNSKRVEKYDLLVAADGLGSKIRGTLLEKPSRDQIHDEGVHVAYFTIKEDLLKGSKIAQGFSTTNGRVLYLRPDPAGRTSCLMMNVTWSNNVEMKKRLNDAIKEGNDAYKRLLHAEFSDAGWVTPKVLQAMDESDDFYCSIFGQVRSPTLQRGRVVLLGDAGYATPGFGTSLAIIGSYVLAGELAAQGSDPTQMNLAAALERYEAYMLPLVKKSQDNFPFMQMLHPQTTWGISVRNVILRLVMGLRLDKLMFYLAPKLGFTDKGEPMPEYPWKA